MENEAPLSAGRDLRMDLVIERGGLRGATAPGNCQNVTLLDATADPEATNHLRAGSADLDGLAAFQSEARNCHRYAPPGQSFLRQVQLLTRYPIDGYR